MPQVVVIEECAPNGSLAMRVKELAWDIGAKPAASTPSRLRMPSSTATAATTTFLDAHGLGVPEMTARLELQ